MTAKSAYDLAWEKVMYGNETDLFAARETAYSWHGGQESALYSFASTECTVWTEAHRANLIADVERAMTSVRKDPLAYYATWEDVDQFTREKFQSGTPESEWGSPSDAGIDSLENLLRCIRALPAKNPETEV